MPEKILLKFFETLMDLEDDFTFSKVMEVIENQPRYSKWR